MLEVAPGLELFADFECEFPIRSGSVKISWKDSILEVYTNQEGGVIKVQERVLPLLRDQSLRIKIH